MIKTLLTACLVTLLSACTAPPESRSGMQSDSGMSNARVTTPASGASGASSTTRP